MGYYLIARAIVNLRDAEEAGPNGGLKRDSKAQMNFNNALDKDWETKTLAEICEGPPSLLQGLAERANERLSKQPLNITTIEKLANFKFCRWASSIVELAKWEIADHSSIATGEP